MRNLILAVALGLLMWAGVLYGASHAGRWWWVVLAGWCAVLVLGFWWAWIDIGRIDARLEREEAALNLDYDAMMEAVGQEIGRQQDFAKAAVIPISTAEFQERMRKAESLGFLDNDWPRAS